MDKISGEITLEKEHKPMKSWTLDHHKFDDMTKTEAEHLFEFALGRIFRLGSRPKQKLDDKQFEQCKYILQRASEVLKGA